MAGFRMLGRHPERIGDPCWYCGSLNADTWDHVQPINSMHNGSRELVRACRDCNCHILRDHPASTKHDRAAVVAMALDTRLNRSVRGTWTDQQLTDDEVRGRLKQACVSDRQARAALIERFHHAVWRSKPPNWQSL